ncbi:RNA polymerase sigma-70 factor (sigma-E family) [Stackebrandtia albiflava]|uniref:RNA polymerase sigma-70 factor (Sigma-E family) n=1 Tax=Stackebrandtia albiflava TaxID=406432 RepID=A0A562V4X2_9ACTN|nr:SigE family RNA polymerase sigma factor [Stackebrandtia albiflava]TWJ12872.1 RNA polymerase sigma-70 factor (sigma-E family) [Stackebrandtia albiflava]
MSKAEDSVEDQFREFVAARSAALHRAAYLLTGNWATAEDLVQTALTKTYLAWRRIGHIDSVEAYARRVLYNANASWWRRRSSGERPIDVIPEPRTAQADGGDDVAQRDLMWRYLMALPRRQRAVLVLRFYEDLSEAESARILGVSTGTIKSQTSRALANLRARLAADGMGTLTDIISPVDGRSA